MSRPHRLACDSAMNNLSTDSRSRQVLGGGDCLMDGLRPPAEEVLSSAVSLPMPATGCTRASTPWDRAPIRWWRPARARASWFPPAMRSRGGTRPRGAVCERGDRVLGSSLRRMTTPVPGRRLRSSYGRRALVGNGGMDVGDSTSAAASAPAMSCRNRPPSRRSQVGPTPATRTPRTMTLSSARKTVIRPDPSRLNPSTSFSHTTVPPAKVPRPRPGGAGTSGPQEVSSRR